MTSLDLDAKAFFASKCKVICPGWDLLPALMQTPNEVRLTSNANVGSIQHEYTHGLSLQTQTYFPWQKQFLSWKRNDLV